MVIPVKNGVHTREDLWSLDVWDPTLLWYAKAMGAMFARPLQDPSSWRYQAAIHGYIPGEPDLQALLKPGDQIPADSGTYWAQCQHHGWFFLPWHRGYLGYFERIVRKTIVGLGGPADWALPYWNYSDTQHNAAVARLVRPEFVAHALPDGSPNPFSHGVQRSPFNLVHTPKGQAGDFNVGSKDVRLKCLTYPHFYDHASASSFGGGITAFNHGESPNDTSAEGSVEKTPHDNIHGDIGGWMDSFETAGLDPLFWMHHCNIDRLWSVWAAAAGHSNPADAAWLNPAGPHFPYRFRDENGVSQTFTPQSVLNTEASPFAYRFQDLNAPPHVAVLAAKLQIPPAVSPAPPPQAPRLAAASDTDIDLSPEQVSVGLPIDDAAPTINLAAAGGPRQAYLNVENVVGAGKLETRYVYLNLPDATAPDQDPDLYLGSLPMFGVREMSRGGAAGAGNGKSFVLNATDVIAHLQQTGHWDGKEVRVYLIAKNPPAPGSKLTAGRLSLYYR